MSKNPFKWKGYGPQIRSFADLLSIHSELESDNAEWIFRGQMDGSKSLKSTIERCFLDFAIPQKDYLHIEVGLIHEFIRYFHLYGTTPAPDVNDTLAYLALMRHYGSPARILDFSFSLFIACYFAIEFKSSNPIVWAINKTWLTKHLNKQVLAQPNGKDLLDQLAARKGKAFNDVFMQHSPTIRLIGPVNPSFMNDRIAVQKGLFLCSTDISIPFDQVLRLTPDSTENVRKISISQHARPKLLSTFERVNINRVGLFPGLQGFGESLYSKVLLFERFERMRRKGGRVGPRSLGL